MLPGSENIILIYRIHYKAMNTVVPNLREETTKLISLKGTTTFFITDLEKGNLVVPKSIEWEQVNLPENWILEEAVPPKKEESHDVESIIETNNGTVAISFARTRSRNSFSGRSVVSEPVLPRPSLSGIELDRMNSMSRLSSIGTQRTEEQVAQPIYGLDSTYPSPKETVLKMSQEQTSGLNMDNPFYQQALVQHLERIGRQLSNLADRIERIEQNSGNGRQNKMKGRIGLGDLE
ncbi:hypothetical protein GH714_006477 [Hevea brasiliensis]|uniref:Uncharacterized protein n=1 Tax=Hevea brasiliensis TaxID=3981 RepID=A0A6A6L634_HEVBR|nr:hypothetical protein GH714_006477 [Hevea brasiliensis]